MPYARIDDLGGSNFLLEFQVTPFTVPMAGDIHYYQTARLGDGSVEKYIKEYTCELGWVDVDKNKLFHDTVIDACRNHRNNNSPNDFHVRVIDTALAQEARR